MKYYEAQDGTRVKIEGNKAFAKFSDGVEKAMKHPSTTVTDAIISGTSISEKDYIK